MSNYSKTYFTNISEKNEEILNSYLEEVEKIGFKVSGKRILDIGCATGNFINLLLDTNQVYGIDISVHAISQCKKRFPKIKDSFQQIDLNKEVPLYNEQFDAIFMLDVIEHLINFEFLSKTIKKYLNKDGVLFLTTPNANSATRFLKRNHFTGEYDETHTTLFTPYTLDFTLRRMGLRKLLLTTPFNFIRSNKLLPKVLPMGGQILAIYKLI